MADNKNTIIIKDTDTVMIVNGKGKRSFMTWEQYNSWDQLIKEDAIAQAFQKASK